MIDAERPPPGAGHPGAEAEGDRAVTPPGQLDSGGAAGAGQDRGVVGHVPARAQSRPAGGPHRLVAPAGSEENAPVGGANVVAGGSDRRGRSRSRGEGGRRDERQASGPKGRGAKGKGKGKKGKARWK